MFRWHYVKDGDLPNEKDECMYFCQLDQRNIYYDVCTYAFGKFWWCGEPVKVSKWCDVEDVAHELDEREKQCSDGIS